jgi:hypothetical protein
MVVIIVRMPLWRPATPPVYLNYPELSEKDGAGSDARIVVLKQTR